MAGRTSLAGIDEHDMFEVLTGSKGLEIGVHDPDFLDPLESTLYVVAGGIMEHHQRLRLDCEDDDLGLTCNVSQVKASPCAVGGGCGITLTFIDGPLKDKTRILVATGDKDLSAEFQQDILIRVIERLHKDPKSLRGAGSWLTMLTCGSKAAQKAAAPSARRLEAMADKAATKISTKAALNPDGKVQRSMSMGSVRGGSFSIKRALTNHWGRLDTPEDGPPDLGLEDVRTFARTFWDSSRSQKSGGRRTSITDRMMGVKNAGRQLGDASGTSAPSESLVGVAAAVAAADRRDLDSCARMLLQLVCADVEDNDEVLPAQLFFGRDDTDSMCFDEFWKVCAPLLALETLEVEPVLQKKFGAKCLRDPEHADQTKSIVLPLVDYMYFLGSSQHETMRVIEEADQKVKELRAPEGDGKENITLYGLSRLLCATDNSILDPSKRMLREQDMACRITDYWIASTHHIYADPPPEEELTSPTGTNSDAGLSSIGVALKSGCRCLSLALVGPEHVRGAAPPDDGELHVLLGKHRVALDLVLECIDSTGFQNEQDWPILLVLSLGLLSPSGCCAVPGAVRKGLDKDRSRLWANIGAELPTPMAARGKVVVILAPTASGPEGSQLDLSLTEGIAPALARGSGVGLAEARASATADPVESLLELEKTATVWRGRPFDPTFPQQLAHEISVGFLSCDELQVLEAAGKGQALLEYHKQYLTLAYPLTSRFAPSSFNVGAAWSAGVQMAALTLDQFGSATLAHMGRFGQINGGSGYVLKPTHMCGSSLCQDAAVHGKDESAATATKPLALEFRLLAARAVPGANGRRRPTGSVAVAVSIWGCEQDSSRRLMRPTSIGDMMMTWKPEGANADGWAPAHAVFPITSPGTAVITFEVFDVDPAVGRPCRLAVFAAPVDGLRPGVRWVPLWAPEGPCIRPTIYGSLSGLLVFISKKGGRP